MENYFFKKEIDWATLHQGFTIPRKQHDLFLHHIKYKLRPGEHLDIIFLIKNEKFTARMRNVNFNKKRYPDHTPILQIRYDNNKILTNKLQSIFLNSYNYISNERKLKEIKGKKYIKIPNSQKEFLILYSTEFSDTFILDYLTFKDNNDLRNIIKEKEISENDIELILNEKDYNAKIELQNKLIKVRKLNSKIGIRLKELYDYKCQICGYTAFDNYKCYISETHHIKSFVESFNNDPENILIVCPNHHRIIHRSNPEFVSNRLLFQYPNGLEEKLLLNKHL